MADNGSALTVSEAARRAGLSRPVIMHWIKLGRLPTTRVGRHHRLRLADVRALADAAYAGGVVLAWRDDAARAGQRLRTLREAAGWNQQQLAARAGLTHEAISNLERARRIPRAPTIHALAAVLAVPPERFIDQTALGLSMLSVDEAAMRLDVPAGRLQEWLRHGQLPGQKVGGRWRVLAITIAELERSGRLRGRSRRLDPRFRG
jgi:excisionase family DNA binding protein